MTSPKTPEWAEHWGRDAVRLGFVEWLRDFECLQIAWLHCYDAELPNLAHAHTELVVIPWVQAVAREVYGGKAWVRMDAYPDEVLLHVSAGHGGPFDVLTQEHTLAEAACRLVAAMRGEA